MKQVSEAQSREAFSCWRTLAPASTPPGPPVKIQRVIHRCCAYSCLKRSNHKPRPAASSVSLGAAQQGAPDSLRIHLDVVWVGLQVGGGGISGNSLGRMTSSIQFELLAIVMLCPSTGSGEGSTRNNGYPGTSVQSKSCLVPHSDNVSLPVSPWYPLRAAKTTLVLRASRFFTAKIHWWTWPL